MGQVSHGGKTEQGKHVQLMSGGIVGVNPGHLLGGSAPEAEGDAARLSGASRRRETATRAAGAREVIAAASPRGVITPRSHPGKAQPSAAYSGASVPVRRPEKACSALPPRAQLQLSTSPVVEDHSVWKLKGSSVGSPVAR